MKDYCAWVYEMNLFLAIFVDIVALDLDGVALMLQQTLKKG
ncbi:hypothetical protein [Metabacillus malikii]|uniref:Uncharacterized protein n=1 Tax=Metabacillus malikii TaxID=1504265 RepID=A0ABT9ZKR7_9BACI|nr:hypothetical protein [Metabacillus malikii]MDQ0232489.1 hypothetical protein [Metabacillus malikii]